MASTCDIYKDRIKLGSGSCSAASTSITSFSAASGARAIVNGKNLTVVVTQAGTHAGRAWNTKVVSGGGTSTLVLKDACPYVGA